MRITKLSISEDREKECQLPSKGRDNGEKKTPHKILKAAIPPPTHPMSSSVFRSDHQSGGVQLSAPPPRPPPPRRDLLAEGANR